MCCSLQNEGGGGEFPQYDVIICLPPPPPPPPPPAWYIGRKCGGLGNFRRGRYVHSFLVTHLALAIFIYLGFYVAFNTVQVISRRVVGRAEETSTYSSLGFCTVNCRPTASNYQLSHMRPCRESNPGLRGGR